MKTYSCTIAAFVAVASTLFLAADMPALAQEATSASQPSLRFSDADKVLEVQLEPDFFWVDINGSDESASTSVTVINGSNKEVHNLRFCPMFGRDEADKERTDIKVKTIGSNAMIAPNGSKTFELEIRLSEPVTEVTGELIVGGETEDGVLLPGRRSFEISQPAAALSGNEGSFGWFDWIVIASGVSSLVMVGYYALSMSHALRRRLGKHIDWDPKSAWASTLTTAGGVTGAILTTQVLPKETTLLSNAQFAALGVLFAIFILFGPFFFNFFRREMGTREYKDGKRVPKQEGYVGTFLLAMFITLWGVFGQLAMVVLVLNELKVQGTTTDLVTVILLIVFFVAAIFTFLYARNGINDALEEVNRSPTSQTQVRAAESDE